MNTIKMIGLVCLMGLMLLTACSSGYVGVSHRQLAPGVYAIAARGDEDANEAETESAMFQRAAKLTIKTGYRYFTLEATQTEVKTVDDELIPRSYARIKMHNEPGDDTYDAHMVISNLPE
jgi:uncharacterized protein (DUF2141 family)